MIKCPECDCAWETSDVKGPNTCWNCGFTQVNGSEYFEGMGRKTGALTIDELFHRVGVPGFEDVGS